MPYAQIAAIEFHLPDQVLANDELADIYSGWTAEAIEQKLGVRTRRIAAEGETSGDLAVLAAEKLFRRIDGLRDQVDFLIFCTQEPDHFLPTTACLTSAGVYSRHGRSRWATASRITPITRLTPSAVVSLCLKNNRSVATLAG